METGRFGSFNNFIHAFILELFLGTLPGSGGTQRLTRVIGKSKAMEMCLTGNMIDATEAEKVGLVSKVFPAAELVDKAVALAEQIGKQSPLAVQLCKEAVNTAYESTLQEGLKFEKRHFHATFSTVLCRSSFFSLFLFLCVFLCTNINMTTFHHLEFTERPFGRHERIC